jgi:hypothetical protein
LPERWKELTPAWSGSIDHPGSSARVVSQNGIFRQRRFRHVSDACQVPHTEFATERANSQLFSALQSLEEGPPHCKAEANKAKRRKDERDPALFFKGVEKISGKANNDATK